ncbi:MAG TPA: KEOPS complex subunit Pcc1 [Nitrososphaeraceae archaeon]|nr:KEOPS complex subunit Pcc1 [Nitrososphaeraceae archaeon]
MKINVTSVIEIKFSNNAEMNAIMKALIPDNINFPNGLSMQMFSKDNNILLLEFFCNVGIGTLLNTIDEVLDHISVAKKVIADA